MGYLLPRWFSLFLLCVFVIVSFQRSQTEARRAKSRKGCDYFRKKEIIGKCDPKTNTVPVQVSLKSGPESCEPTKIIRRSCESMSKKLFRSKKDRTLERRKNRKLERKSKNSKDCLYRRNGSPWSKCDKDKDIKTKEMPLLKGSSHGCAPVRIKTRLCKNRKDKKAKKDCVYTSRMWSECNPETNMRVREKVLSSGDASVCQPKKVVTKKCKKECQYIRGPWSDCNETASVKNRTLEPKLGSMKKCRSQVQYRPCKSPSSLSASKNKCKYNTGDLSSCDPRSNTMIQFLILKSGDPNECKREVKLVKKCRVACKFRRGNWSACDEQSLLTTRVDTLVKGHPEECDVTRQITKKCKKKECKYSMSDWGDCDPTTNVRTRVKTLVEGDSDKCKPKEVISKSCTRRDGEARCFFGQWGEFGPCKNGVMTKHRPVFQGGVDCERKAVIASKCHLN